MLVAFLIVLLLSIEYVTSFAKSYVFPLIFAPLEEILSNSPEIVFSFAALIKYPLEVELMETTSSFASKEMFPNTPFLYTNILLSLIEY